MRKSISFTKAAWLSGLATVVLANVAARFGNAGGGVPSPFDARPGDVAGYYADHSTFTATSGYLYGLAAVCLVIFSVAVWDRLCRRERSEARLWALVGMTGAAIYAVLLLILGLLQLALVGVALRDGASSQVVTGLAVVWAGAAVLLVPGSVPLLLGFGMAARRSGAFSGLLCFFALCGAALGVLPPPEVLGPLSPVAANLAFVLSEAQPWMLVFWVLGTAFVMRRTEIQAEQGEEAIAAAGDAGG